MNQIPGQVRLGVGRPGEQRSGALLLYLEVLGRVRRIRTEIDGVLESRTGIDAAIPQFGGPTRLVGVDIIIISAYFIGCLINDAPYSSGTERLVD